MKFVDKVAFIYVKNGKILSTRSKGKDVFYIPGGKREEKETDEETLIREVKEELSVEVKKQTIQYYGTFEAQAHGKAEGVIVKMTCYTAEIEGTLKPDSEIEEMVWLNYQDKSCTSPVDHLIFDDLYEKGILK